ncbi:hypothetical protein V1511DRAFT_500969 [Dipodascopsis uninucleata]
MPPITRLRHAIRQHLLSRSQMIIFRQGGRRYFGKAITVKDVLFTPLTSLVSPTAHADFKGRLDALLNTDKEVYPVIQSDNNAQRIGIIREKYGDLSAEQLIQLNPENKGLYITVRGRIHSIRTQGSKLLFLDIFQEESSIQGIYRQNSIANLDASTFKKSYENIRRGDFVSISGTLCRTKTGELSVRAVEPIILLSPCLHPIPTELLNEKTRAHHRTVDFLVRDRSRKFLRARSKLISSVRDFLDAKDFIEVQTPILSDIAGGAAARPFLTHANVLGGTESNLKNSKAVPLELRIAPELWLKRLIIGGFDRVFEIGPVFRNEGIDATHNPEFTTCEFYQAFANLDDLIRLTEDMIRSIVKDSIVSGHTIISENIKERNWSFDGPFPRIDFIQAIEDGLGEPLPDYVYNCHADEHSDLSSNAHDYLAKIFRRESIPLPQPSTVPRMLDKLADYYIGPLLEATETPIFLINFPESLSPLAKSAKQTFQGRNYQVARRFELYLGGKELVNAYEEENSPFAQRRKLKAQISDREKRGDFEAHPLDEGYLASLEWGLPPTGGWGMGLDRLAMLLTGAEKLSDVLAFGGIKGVVKQE